METQDRLGSLALKVLVDLLDGKDPRVLLEIKVLTGQLVHKASVVRMVNKVLLDLMVRKDPKEVLDHGVMPVILDLSDLLERLDLWVALGQLDNLVILDCRVCRVKWVQLGFKDPLDHRELLDHLDKLVHLDCRDLQEFQVVKDSKEPLVLVVPSVCKVKSVSLE